MIVLVVDTDAATVLNIVESIWMPGSGVSRCRDRHDGMPCPDDSLLYGDSTCYIIYIHTWLPFGI